MWLSEGSWVEKGDKIGEVGSSGISTGPHLHFEVKTPFVDYQSIDPYIHMPMPPYKCWSGHGCAPGIDGELIAGASWLNKSSLPYPGGASCSYNNMNFITPCTPGSTPTTTAAPTTTTAAAAPTGKCCVDNLDPYSGFLYSECHNNMTQFDCGIIPGTWFSGQSCCFEDTDGTGACATHPNCCDC
jgi:hypothetical protein